MKCRLGKSNATALLLAALLIAGCQSSFVTDELAIKISDTNVWCDFMPGAIPRTNAVMDCELRNATTQPITLSQFQGVIIDAKSTSELRRFTCRAFIDEQQRTEITLKPNEPVRVTFRTPTQVVVPIDLDVYPRVQFVLRAETSIEKFLVVTSPMITAMKTQ